MNCSSWFLIFAMLTGRKQVQRLCFCYWMSFFSGSWSKITGLELLYLGCCFYVVAGISYMVNLLQHNMHLSKRKKHGLAGFDWGRDCDSKWCGSDPWSTYKMWGSMNGDLLVPPNLLDIPTLAKKPWLNRRSQEGAWEAMPSKFLEHIVILCFERRYPKQNSVISLKSNILRLTKNFWAGYNTARLLCFLILYLFRSIVLRNGLFYWHKNSGKCCINTKRVAGNTKSNMHFGYFRFFRRFTPSDIIYFQMTFVCHVSWRMILTLLQKKNLIGMLKNLFKQTLTM